MMLYALNEFGYYASTPWRYAARAARDFWHAPYNPAVGTEAARNAYAAADLFANVTRRYGKPDWRIHETQVNGSAVRVEPTVAWSSPWVDVIHFARRGSDLRRAGKRTLDPTVLIVAPLSGHYATLLRGTVESFLPDHEVYITDWANARSVPLLEGRFDFHDYIDVIIEMLRVLGPRAHVVAVCQPGPPVLAAASLMAEDGEESRPSTRGSPRPLRTGSPRNGPSPGLRPT
jgi:poly(3-hydroxybutyrate) depolymerase